MVQPISELEELETRRGGAKKAMQRLRKSVKGATSMKQVKKVMQKTIKGAVLKKKASLLQKASDKMKSAAKREGKKLVKKKNNNFVERKTKIFKVKNQEAKTLEKMNELNIRVGMKSRGIRASMLKKGRTAIVNGELIKAKAKYNVKRSFQGSKQRNDPKLMPPTRDPRKDKLKKLSG